MPPLQFSKTLLFPAPTVQVILATQSPDSHLTNHAPASGPALTLVPLGLVLTSFLQDPPVTCFSSEGLLVKAGLNSSQFAARTLTHHETLPFDLIYRLFSHGIGHFLT